MTDTAALREAAEKATPGPWRAETKPNFGNGYIYTAVLPAAPNPATMRHLEMASGEFHVCRMTHTPMPEKADLYRRDSEFIALANPATILSLLDELDRLRASPAPDRVEWPASHSVFAPGDRVEKIKGSSWHGTVCGWYRTELTPEGYCVESEREPGSVQLYPVAALSEASK